jgi:hypothetical protein
MDISTSLFSTPDPSVVSLIGVQYFIVAYAWFGRSQVIDLKAFSDPPFV